MAESSKHHAVLVVENEAIIRMYAVAMLEDAGFCVLEAKNGEDALAILIDHSEVGVLVTDVCMPGRMNGLQLVGRVQEHNPSIRSIVVSATSSTEDALSAGAVRFIPKPYFGNAIVTAVHETMQGAPEPSGKKIREDGAAQGACQEASSASSISPQAARSRRPKHRANH